MPRSVIRNESRRKSAKPQMAAPASDSPTKQFFKDLKDEVRAALKEWSTHIEFAKNEHHKQITFKVSDELKAIMEDVLDEIAQAIYRVIARFQGTRYIPERGVIQLPRKGFAQLA